MRHCHESPSGWNGGLIGTIMDLIARRIDLRAIAWYRSLHNQIYIKPVNNIQNLVDLHFALA
jgi:hypothetical protein